jgi:hypothetical protein
MTIRKAGSLSRRRGCYLPRRPRKNSDLSNGVEYPGSPTIVGLPPPHGGRLAPHWRPATTRANERTVSLVWSVRVPPERYDG